MRRAAYALATSLVATACGKSGASLHLALPYGGYAVSAPVCHSTGQSPAYRDPKYRVALLDFVDLKSHTLDVRQFEATEIFAGANCTLLLRRGVHDNANGYVSFRRNPHWTFGPPGCTLAVATTAGVTPVSSDYSDVFSDRDDASRDVPYEVQSDPSGTKLVTIEDDQLSALFKTYGCPDGDRLELRLNGL